MNINNLKDGHWDEIRCFRLPDTDLSSGILSQLSNGNRFSISQNSKLLTKALSKTPVKKKNETDLYFEGRMWMEDCEDNEEDYVLKVDNKNRRSIIKDIRRILSSSLDTRTVGDEAPAA